MVLRFLLPSEGGGSLRRFLAIRNAVYADAWRDNRPFRGPVTLLDFRRRDDAADLRASLRPGGVRGLYRGWRVSDDGVIGGFSTSAMRFVEGDRTGPDREGEDGGKDEKEGGRGGEDDVVPHLRWSGTLDTKINRQSHLARNITRSGFAAVLSPEFPLGAPLGSRYTALEICCRTDGRTYTVNLQVETYFPGEMYQGFIVGDEGDRKEGGVGGASTEKTADSDNRSSERQEAEDDGDGGPPTPSLDMREYLKDRSPPAIGDDPEAHPYRDDPPDESPDRPAPSLDVREHLRNRRRAAMDEDPDIDPVRGHPPRGFRRYVLPFRDFVLTQRGRAKEAQRDLDGGVNVESVGFTLMDGEDGPFRFDLVSLRAVNVLDGEVVGSPEDELREAEFRERLRPKVKRGEGGEGEDGDSKDEKSKNGASSA